MAKGDVSNRTTKLTLRQEIDVDKFGNQTLSNINPSINDDKVLYFGNALGGLCTKTLDKVIRTDKYDIAAE